jgi:ABC-type amino acid transport substrate-binding protein
MDDRAFDGVAGIGVAAVGGTVGAFALGPALDGVLAQSFGQISRRFVTSLSTRLAFAEQGAVAGTMVQPMGGQVIGAAIGAAIGVIADYLGNAANEAFNRDEFVAANNRALDATIATWKTKLTANIDAAIDKWFDDARSTVVLTAK